MLSGSDFPDLAGSSGGEVAGGGGGGGAGIMLRSTLPETCAKGMDYWRRTSFGQ